MLALALTQIALALNLSPETWTVIGAMADLGAFVLMVLQMLFQSPHRSAPHPPPPIAAPAPRAQKPAKRSPELILLHDVIGLSAAEIATATGAAPSTVRAWLAYAHAPTGIRAKRLSELTVLSAHLLTFTAPSLVGAHLRRTPPELAGRTPLQAFSEDDHARLTELLETLGPAVTRP